MTKKEDVSDSMLLADALLRVKAMENLLISKGLITREELTKEMEDITIMIAKKLLEKANVSGDLDQILQEIRTNSSDKN